MRDINRRRLSITEDRHSDMAWLVKKRAFTTLGLLSKTKRRSRKSRTLNQSHFGASILAQVLNLNRSVHADGCSLQDNGFIVAQVSAAFTLPACAAFSCNALGDAQRLHSVDKPG